MAGTYAYTPEIWLPLAAAIFLATLGLYGWRRRDVPGAWLLAMLDTFDPNFAIVAP